MIEPNLGDNKSDSAFRIPVLCRDDFPLLNNIVCQQLTGNFIQIGFHQTVAFYAVTPGGVNGFTGCQAEPQQIFNGFNCSGARIVAHTRAVSDPYGPVERKVKRFKRGKLGDRICKNISLDLFKLIRVQLGIDG